MATNLNPQYLFLVEIGVSVYDGTMVNDVMIVPAGCIMPRLKDAIPRLLAEALLAEPSL